MKVVKDPEHGMLLNYFGLDNRFYLALTVLTFFDFNNPDQPLTEQEMWPFVQAELGKDAILDMAMPKPRGEVLVWGRCFAPGGEPTPAIQAGIRIGSISKTLNVFGDRYWSDTREAFSTIGTPQPFTEMPLTYARAFGGEGFEKNPIGRGIAPVRTQTGIGLLLLPNIEYPGRLIGSPIERPDPAGFAPIDFRWAPRSKKVGTYDDKWLRERWPFFPDDMDWTYFNAAPEDQQLQDFFNGGESFAAINLHKTKPLLRSRVPALRQRLFLNQLTDFRKRKGETAFKDIKTRIDTLWLFPHAERGIAVYRGAAEVADDEALDVLHLYIATESLAEEPKAIEKYYEEFQRRIDRTVPAEYQTKMAEANRQFAAAAERLRDLPREIQDGVARGLGQAPSPVRTPQEIVSRSVAQMEEQKKLLDDAERRFAEMKAKFGHMAKIDLSLFDRARQQLDHAKGKLLEIPGRADAAQKKAADGREALKKHMLELQGKVDPAVLAEHGLDDPDMLFAPFVPGPKNPWHEQGMRFIEQCRDELESRPEVGAALSKLGLRRYTVKRAWLGINPEPKSFDPLLWGMKPARAGGPAPPDLTIPAGFVIPFFDGPTLIRIVVRQFKGSSGTAGAGLPVALMRIGGDAPVDGSAEACMVLSPGEGKPVVCVANELEALLLDQDVHSFCTVVAMRDPGAQLPKNVDSTVKEAPQFFVVSYPQASEAKDQGIDPWKSAFPRAEPLDLPAGSSLFEARRKGADLWRWIVGALRPEYCPGPEAAPKEIDPAKPGALAELVPTIDVPSIIQNVRDTLMRRIQPKLNIMEAKKKEILAMAQREMKKHGLNPDELLKPSNISAARGSNPLPQIKEKYAAGFARTREQLKKAGHLTPTIEKKLAEAEKLNQDLLSNAIRQYDEGMAKLEAGKAKCQGGLPQWAVKLMANLGIDASGPNPLKPLTREEVIERHRSGLSLAGKNLAGLDLSNLDLRGADMKGTNLQKANLSGSQLDKADLTRAIASESDFSNASLRGTTMGGGLFQKGKFKNADIREADLKRAILSETDLSGADLRGSLIEGVLWEKAKMGRAKLANANAKQSYFLSTEMPDVDCRHANLEKAVFLNATLDNAAFSGSTAHKAAFLGCSGEKVDFSEADMHNSRILNESSFPGANFNKAKAERASWMRSNLSGSDFRGCRLRRGLIEECDLTEANLAGVSADEARFTKSDLTGADLKGAHLFQGSLRKTKLARADLRSANLYSVEFFRTGVWNTQFDGANLKMTKLYRLTHLLPKSDTKGS